MSEQTYTFDTEIGGRSVRIEYRAPESGVEPQHAWYLTEYGVTDHSETYSLQRFVMTYGVLIHEACERDWSDRMQAQLDAEGDAALERKRDGELE